ncbi:MAG: protein kinase [Deltaproteobacteria bacterium]|nr:protein kinase [Deltaproteobacteria bacterium]
MAIELPNKELIKQKFSQISDLEHIATGGFKVVYKAKVSGIIEAVKLVQIPMLENSEEADGIRKEFIGRIEREVLALGKCKVNELVKLGSITHQLTHLGAQEYFVYSEEFIQGQNLFDSIRESLKSNGPKPSELELKQLFVALLRAIKNLWEHDYIHRDIKPCNIIKTGDKKRPFVLLDLGIAFSTTDTALTFNAQNRLPPATYRYLAPEMMDPNFRQNIDYRSDLYNAALSIYEYACFKHPLAQSQDDLVNTISRAIRQKPVPLRDERPDLTEALCQIIDQMLKKKPALRPSNIQVMIKKLEGSL